MNYTIRKHPHYSRRINKKYVAMLCIFFALVLVYKTSGLQPITGFAVLGSGEETSGHEELLKLTENQTNYTEQNPCEEATTSSGSGASISGTTPPTYRPSIKISFPLELNLPHSAGFNVTIINPTGQILTNLSLTSNSTNILVHSTLPDIIGAESTVIIPVNLSTQNSSCFVETAIFNFKSNTYQAVFQIKIHANGVWTTGGVYYNRTMPKSASYEIVPVPNAFPELSETCAGYEQNPTDSLGTFQSFRPAEPVNITIIAPGFLASRHARKELEHNEQNAHFLLLIGKSKLSPAENAKLILGESSEITYAAVTEFPDTILLGYESLKDVKLELTLIKEFGEETYELSEPTYSYHNLSAGTQLITANITIPGSLSSRDLNAPKLRARLKTSTSDIIYEKSEKVTLGFILAELNTSTIKIRNPTSRTIEGITLASEITNELGSGAIVEFSNNQFALEPNATVNIQYNILNTEQGNYTGHISVSGTLPPLGDWDEPASDLIFLPVGLNLEVHDISLTLTSPLVITPNTPLKFLITNKKSHNETTNFTLGSCSELIEITSGESKVYTPTCEIQLVPGSNNLSASAKIPMDYTPWDNSQTFQIFVTNQTENKNAIILIFDGLGSQYLNRAETPTFKALQHRGLDFTNARVRIPSTTESHSILFTSQYKLGYDYKAFSQTVALPNNTIFDSAREQGYIILGVMGQGDSPQAVSKMDAALWDANNNWDLFDSNLNYKNISPKLLSVMQQHNNLPDYKDLSDCEFCDYDQWTADAVTSLIENAEEPFILTVNFAGTDHAGHSGPADYLKTKVAADAQLNQILNTLMQTGLAQNTILIVTADHGMCFREGSYGWYGYHASCADEPAYQIPLTIIVPGRELTQSSSLTYLEDTTVTLETLLNMNKQQNPTGITRPELFGDFSDIGIESLSQTQAVLKNHGTFEETVSICFTTSQTTECRQAALAPKAEEIIYYNFTPQNSGIHKLTVHLENPDANPHNNQLTESVSAGAFTDLGIGKIWYDLTDQYYNNSTQKIELDIDICNNGNLDFEGKVGMHIWIENCTESFCNKTYNPTFSAKIGNCNTYKSDAPFGLQSGFQTIYFEINTTDADLNNNEKTLTTFT
ncbi:MAG: sulfatase-like hydrolase/transferase [archaeon]